MDVTIDFETCAMTANAAVMQVAMVPWARYNETDPFLFEDSDTAPYVGYVDLRTCVVGGFDFDPETIKWWAERNFKAKEAVVKGKPEAIDNVLIGMLNYIRGLREKYELTSICIWCQGMDFDIAILRNLCRKYGVELEEEIPHTSFRDCRTVILEAAVTETRRTLRGESVRGAGVGLPEQIMEKPSLAYELYKPLPEQYDAGSEAHDALYDARRSSWNTWQALKWLDE